MIHNKLNRQVKDSLFTFIFGEHPENALSLYNAINKTNYTNVEGPAEGRAEGLAEGRAEGLAEGRAEGPEEDLFVAVDKSISSGSMSREQACEILGVSITDYEAFVAENVTV